MGRPVIGRLTAVWEPGGAWRVEPDNRFQLQQLLENLRTLSGGKPLPVRVTVEKQPKRRSLNQNAMMWALLRIMADHEDTFRSAEDCYADMLELFGARYEVFAVDKRAVDYLRVENRVVKPIELMGGDMVTVKVIEGSSGFTTAEMSAFIERIFDTLAEMGVNDPEVTDYWRRWREDDLPGMPGR